MKRLMETIFVHRFSHGTMPLRKIVRVRTWLSLNKRAVLTSPPPHMALFSLPPFQLTLCCVEHNLMFTYAACPDIHTSVLFIFCSQNCAYYWGFSAWLAYYINHPLYTPPCKFAHARLHTHFTYTHWLYLTRITCNSNCNSQHTENCRSTVPLLYLWYVFIKK